MAAKAGSLVEKPCTDRISSLLDNCCGVFVDEHPPDIYILPLQLRRLYRPGTVADIVLSTAEETNMWHQRDVLCFPYVSERRPSPYIVSFLRSLRTTV